MNIGTATPTSVNKVKLNKYRWRRYTYGTATREIVFFITGTNEISLAQNEHCEQTLKRTIYKSVRELCAKYFAERQRNIIQTRKY